MSAGRLAPVSPERRMADRMTLDLSHADAVAEEFAAVASRHGPLGVPVNIAAVAAARQMASAGWGRIVSIASVRGVRASLDRAVDGTPEAAVIGLTRQMDVGLARFGITANAVAPGATEAGFVRRHDPGPVRAAFGTATPDARCAVPSKIAEPVAFLASAAAVHVTGTVLQVDGGSLAAGVLDRAEPEGRAAGQVIARMNSGIPSIHFADDRGRGEAAPVARAPGPAGREENSMSQPAILPAAP